MNANPAKFQKQIAVGVAGAILLVWFIVRILPFHRYRGPIPYVWTDTFNRTVTHYAQIRPSRSVLLISGPRKSGKSRALNQIALDLTDAGNFVINVDPKPARNLTDLLRIVETSIARGLVTVKSRLTNSEMKDLLELQPPIPNCSSPLPLFHEPALDKVYRSLVGCLEGFLGGNYSDAAVHAFFDTLEMYAEVLKPVVLIQGLDRVKAMRGADGEPIGLRIVEAAKRRLSRRDQYEDYVPVFVELQDSAFRLTNRNPVFRFVRAGGMANAQQLFVNKHKVFSGSEFKKITSVLGSNAGTFARVFEDLKFDISLDDSLGRFQQKARTIVNRTMYGRTGSASARFCKSPDGIHLSSHEEIDELAPLIANGYLYVRKGLEVVPLNKEVVRVLCSLQ